MEYRQGREELGSKWQACWSYRGNSTVISKQALQPSSLALDLTFPALLVLMQETAGEGREEGIPLQHPAFVLGPGIVP